MGNGWTRFLGQLRGANPFGGDYLPARVRLFGRDMSRPREARQARARLGFAPDSAGLDPGDVPETRHGHVQKPRVTVEGQHHHRLVLSP